MYSRPGSIRRFPVDDDDANSSNGSPDESSDSGEGSTSDNDNYTAGEAEQDDDHREGSIFRDKSDTRSIRSFSSMMSRDREDDRERERDKRDRPSLTDRLANMPALSRFSVSIALSFLDACLMFNLFARNNSIFLRETPLLARHLAHVGRRCSLPLDKMGGHIHMRKELPLLSSISCRFPRMN